MATLNDLRIKILEKKCEFNHIHNISCVCTNPTCEHR